MNGSALVPLSTTTSMRTHDLHGAAASVAPSPRSIFHTSVTPGPRQIAAASTSAIATVFSEMPRAMCTPSINGGSAIVAAVTASALSILVR